MSKAQFYTPPIPEPAKASEGRFVPNSMEDDAIMRRVSRDLYASETAGLREILANEITAARAAKRLGANPHILVTVKRDQITVWGVDSLGMERKIFDDVYTVLGRSGNFDATTPGQFGLGRAAYVTISDHMLLETRHRNGDCYTALGVEGRGFQVDMGKPDIPYGTRVTLVPRDDVRMYGMTRLAAQVAARCEIPITITTEDGTETPERQQLGYDGSFLEVDLLDAEISVSRGRITRWTGYLCGMPIEFQYRGRHEVSGAVDIHDERKYPPTPDRERMTEEAENAISDIIDREISNRLAGFPSDVNEAMVHPDRELAFDFGLVPDGMRRRVETLNGFGKRAATLGRLNGGPFLACRTFSRRQTGAVLAEYPNAVFIKDAPDGLTTVSEFMKMHGIKQLPPEKRVEQVRGRPASVTIHTPSGPQNVDPADPPKDFTIIRVADGRELNERRDMLYGGRRALTIYDVDGAVTLTEFIMAARAGVFRTSHGMMTGGELIDSGADVRRTLRFEIVGMWTEGGIPGKPGIIVWDEGTEEHEDAYDRLAAVCGRIHNNLSMFDWHSEQVVESYMRLENPIMRRLLAEFSETRRPDLCDEFLAMEGKPPVPHEKECWCGTCRDRRA